VVHSHFSAKLFKHIKDLFIWSFHPSYCSSPTIWAGWKFHKKFLLFGFGFLLESTGFYYLLKQFWNRNIVFGITFTMIFIITIFCSIVCFIFSYHMKKSSEDSSEECYNTKKKNPIKPAHPR